MRYNLAMQLHLDSPESGAVIDACGRDDGGLFVKIGGQLHRESLLLTSQGIVAADLPREVADLQDEHLRAVVALINPRPYVFLLGGGEHSPTLKSEWLAPFAAAGVALETMSLSAACRTYNIVRSDGREAAAILIL